MKVTDKFAGIIPLGPSKKVVSEPDWQSLSMAK
jgi:hypothetical protein